MRRFICAMAIVAAFVICLATPALAQYKVAGTAVAIPGGTNAAVSSTSEGSPSDLTKAWLFWSGDGGTFYIKRYTASATLETVPMKVPANTPITIPAPKPFKVGAAWFTAIHVYAPAVTDSVYAVPLD